MKSPQEEQQDSLFESLKGSRVSLVIGESDLRKLLTKRTETPFPGPPPPPPPLSPSSRLYSVMGPEQIALLRSRGVQIPLQMSTRSLGESGPGEAQKEQLAADFEWGGNHTGLSTGLSTGLNSRLSSGLSNKLKRARDAKSQNPSTDPRKLSPPKKKSSSPPHDQRGAAKGKAAAPAPFSAPPPEKDQEGEEEEEEKGQFNSITVEKKVGGKTPRPWKAGEATDMFQATRLEQFFQDAAKAQKQQHNREDIEEIGDEDDDFDENVSAMNTGDFGPKGYFLAAGEMSQDLWPEPTSKPAWLPVLKVDDLSPADPFTSSAGEGEFSSTSNPFQHLTPNTRERLTKVWSEKETPMEPEKKNQSHSSAESLSSSSKFKTPMVKRKSTTPPSSDPEGMISYPSYPINIDDLDSLKINNPLEGYDKWKNDAATAGQGWRNFGKPETDLEKFNNMEWDKSTNTWRNTEPQSDIEFSPPENPPPETKTPENGNDSNTPDDSFQQFTPSQPPLHHHHHKSSPPSTQPLSYSPPKQHIFEGSDSDSVSHDELDIAAEIVQGASSKPRQLLEESPVKPGSMLDISGKNLDSLRSLPSLDPSLQILNLDNNLISEISNLPSSLVELSLVGNKITAVVNPPSLPNLTSLNLSKNPLEHLRDLHQFRYLKTLRLEKCNISRMNEIKHVESLVSLYMAGNNLDSLDFCADLKHLTFLDVSKNGIGSVEVLLTLPSIRELRIDHNSVKEMRLTNPVTSLRTLQAKSNRMTLFDARSFPSLRNCVIDDNPKCHIINLSKNFPWSQLKAKGLQTSQGLSETGQGNFILAGMSRLKELDLSETKILDSRLLLVRSLECLILRSCDLRELPADFGTSLPDLGYLDIRDNFISDLSPLKGLQKLKGLCLTRNDVQDLEHLHLPTSLLYLDLRYNPVTEGFYPPDNEKYGSEILTGGVPEWHEADADFEATLDDQTSYRRQNYRQALQSMLTQNLLSLDGIKTFKGERIPNPREATSSSVAGNTSPDSPPTSPSASHPPFLPKVEKSHSPFLPRVDNRPKPIELTPDIAPEPRYPRYRIGSNRPHPLVIGSKDYTCKSLSRLPIDPICAKEFSKRSGPSRTLFLGKSSSEAVRLSRPGSWHTLDDSKVWVTDKLLCLPRLSQSKEGERPESLFVMLVEVKLGKCHRQGGLEFLEEFLEENRHEYQSVSFNANEEGESSKIWHIFNRKRCLPVAVCELELVKDDYFGIVQIKQKK